MTTEFDFDGETTSEEEVAEEESAQKRNPLRLILLGLVALVLLCLVCYLASQLLGITIPGLGGPSPAPPPVVEPTEEAAPTDEAEVPVEETTQPQEPPATEEPVVEEQPLPEATEEPAPATGEPVPVTEEAPIPEETEEVVEQPTEEATEEPVPSPPGPTVVITPESCEGNVQPTADAEADPNPAMMGKGQAFVTFDASGSSDPDGTIIEYSWDFGDGSEPQSGQEAKVTHGYTSQGTYEAKLTVKDDCNATAEMTIEVTIVGPTPPANGTGTPTVTPVPPPATPDGNSTATLGFCYRVRRGDTLSGIAAYYGVPLFDLARVNNVWPEYFVLAGESLFVPSEPVKNGPNAYQVQAGDTFYSIAAQCDLSASYLAQVNQAKVDDPLTPGQIVILPLNR